MGELQQKYQQRLVSVSCNQNSHAEAQLFLESYKEELKGKYHYTLDVLTLNFFL